MREWRPARALPMAGMAAAGMILGHYLAYRLAVPNPHVRSAELLRSGHGYWFLAIKAAVAVGLSGAGAFFLRHFRHWKDARTGPVDAYARILFPLAALQLAAFTCTEIVERLAAGAPVGGLFHHHVFLLGVAVQFLVACASALLLLALGRGAAALAELLARTWDRAPRVLSFLRVTLIPQAPVPAGPAAPRAPPRS